MHFQTLTDMHFSFLPSTSFRRLFSSVKCGRESNNEHIVVRHPEQLPAFLFFPFVVQG